MTISAFPRRALIFMIELYRTWISPTRLPSCRFEPTCSAYAVEAVTEWGAVRGGALSIWRLVQCGPWHKPGYDPVPERNRHHVVVTGVETGENPCVWDADQSCVSDADTGASDDAVRSN